MAAAAVQRAERPPRWPISNRSSAAHTSPPSPAFAFSPPPHDPEARAPQRSHCASPPPFPAAIPAAFRPPSEGEDVMRFDPRVHLQLEPPEYLVDLNFQKRRFTEGASRRGGDGGGGGGGGPGLAFTAPFRLLSDEGVEALSALVRRHGSNGAILQSDSRTPRCLRGLAFLSPFVRDLNRCPEVCAALSGFAGDPVCAHSMVMNYSQVNIGTAGLDRPVDAWHVDSVDYVAVILLSAAADMEGGELQVVLRPQDAAGELLTGAGGAPLPSDQVATLSFPGPGFAVFMQGSRVVHHVTAVRAASAPRVTVVNSYMARDVFRADRTRLRTFLDGDPRPVAVGDFARHKTWRVRGLMDHVLEEVGYHEDDAELMSVLNRAITELCDARDLISGARSDSIGYYDEVAKEFLMSPDGPSLDAEPTQASFRI